MIIDNLEFLNSIVWIEKFFLENDIGKIYVLRVNRELKDELITINFENVIFFNYINWTEMPVDFEVIDTFYEPFNKCKEVEFMHSPEREDYSVIRFHSGEHTLIVAARKFYL